MDIKKVYEDGNVYKYLVKGTTIAFVNSLRRAIMKNVPCLAIDEVTFYENDSVIFDEMLANRLGLLPIKTDVKTYKKGDTVKLILEAEGPGIITSKDIKCTDPKIEIADKKIYITKLGEDQHIKLEMTAIMDDALKHAKHQPAIVSHNEIAVIKNEGKVEKLKELMEELPKGSVEEKAGKLFFADPYNITIQNQPVNILDEYGVEVEYKDDEFVLTIETIGQLSIDEVVKSAVAELTNQFNDLEKEVEKL
jgi:DNA-directed RNA polymerase subunit D